MSRQARWAALAVALCLFLAVLVWSTGDADAAGKRGIRHHHHGGRPFVGGPSTPVSTPAPVPPVTPPDEIIVYVCGGHGGTDVWPPPEQCPGQHLPKNLRHAR